MTVIEFIENFKSAKIQNTKTNPNAVGEWIRKSLEIKSYIPFMKKREIAEMIVEQNINVVDGIKKYDSISGYVSLIVASIVAHTDLVFSQNPIEDYDLLAESGLLLDILAEFEGSHKEIDILMHMALDMEMEDNEINALIGHFLDKVLEMFSGVSEALKESDLSKILGADLSEENLTKFIGLLNKIK